LTDVIINNARLFKIVEYRDHTHHWVQQFPYFNINSEQGLPILHRQYHQLYKRYPDSSERVDSVALKMGQFENILSGLNPIGSQH